MGTQTRGVGSETAARLLANDMQKLVVYNYLVNNHGALNSRSLYMMMSLAKQVRGTDTQNTYHWEQEWTTYSYTVSAIITPAAGANTPITVQIAAADHDSYGNTLFDVNQHLVLDVAYTGPNPVQGVINPAAPVVRTANANRITIYPKDPATNFSVGGANEVVVGTAISILTNSQPENGGATQSTRSTFTQYPWKGQIIRGDVSTSGTAMTIASQVPNLDGVDQQYLYEAMQMEIAQARYIDGALLIGKAIDPLSSGVAGMGTTFDGLTTTIANRGQVVASPVGGYTKAYLSNLETLIASQGGPMKYLVLRGRENNNLWSAIVDDFPSGSIKYNEEVPFNSDGIQINTMVKTYKTAGGFEFSTEVVQRWDHPHMEGQVADYTDKAVFIPLGSMQEGPGGASAPQFEILFAAKGGNSRRLVSWEWGGAASSNKDQYDGMTRATISELGPRFMGANMYLMES